MEFDKDILMKAEQRKDMLRQVEQYRLVQQALAGRPPRISFWRRMLHWAEDKLIEIVCFLLRQYDMPRNTSENTLGMYPCEEGI
jgi:hypothetical protein